ncbi:uncharacterized protein LOC143882218 isoform X2 [Tasmannia lanceolata]|uniref:uncharacterized protein LOC143882218 isoform X2 n=1 Tax=Tasmannia lanceolata TaxID=3420 RepID=UPI0040630D58
MDTQMAGRQPHTYDEGHHATDEGEEKKSVLKKVKDKAKKIKNTLVKKRHEEGEGGEEEEREGGDGAPLTGNFEGGVEIPEQSRDIFVNSPPVGQDPNYQTKVAEPIPTGGGNEAGVDPLLPTFKTMNLSDSDKPSTEIHYQFSSSTKTNTFPENPQHVPTQQQSSTYTEKLTSATSAIAGKAISAKNIVASKLGYGPTEDPTESDKDPYEEVKVVETEGGVKRSDTGVSVKEFVAEKLRPGDGDRALSDVILDAIRKRRDDTPENASDQPTVKVSGSPSPGGGLVGLIRAVGSLFGKGGESREDACGGSEKKD